METNFNFNFKSQICTSREQSERLLALGLKKETADMVWHRINSRSETMRWELQPHPPITINNFHGNISRLNVLMQKNSYGKVMTGEEYFHELWGRDIPAWSLDRLRELVPENIFTGVRNQWHRVMYNGVLTYEEGDDSLVSFREANIYDRCVSCIEWLINKWYFPKEYLV